MGDLSRYMLPRAEKTCLRLHVTYHAFGNRFALEGDAAVTLGRLMCALIVTGIATLGVVGCGESKDANTIVVGTEPTFPPFESKNEAGEFVGFDIDMVKAIAASQGLTVEFKDLPFDSLIPALQSGQIDMIASGLSITEERKQAVDYSEPYIEAGLSIAVAKGNTTIKTSADLKGKKVAVQQGSTGATAAEKMKEEGKIGSITQFATVPLAMMELTKGSVDAVINDRPVTEAFVAAQPDQIQLLDETLDADAYGLAVKKGNAELLAKINAGLKAIEADGTMKSIREKYFGAAAK
jgi:polar amino acid transport system substrate-binding protein